MDDETMTAVRRAKATIDDPRSGDDEKTMAAWVLMVAAEAMFPGPLRLVDEAGNVVYADDGI